MSIARVSLLVQTLLLLSPASERKTVPPDPRQFVILGIEIGKDDFAVVQDKLGSGRLCEGKEHAKIARYTNAEEELVFEFGEVGGGDVTGFYLTPVRHDAVCPPTRLRATSSELSTGAGIHLGMKKEEFLRVFGAPQGKTERDEWEYFWQWERTLTDAERRQASTASPGITVGDKAYVSVSVRANFIDGILTYFYISRLEVT